MNYPVRSHWRSRPRNGYEGGGVTLPMEGGRRSLAVVLNLSSLRCMAGAAGSIAGLLATGLLLAATPSALEIEPTTIFRNGFEAVQCDQSTLCTDRDQCCAAAPNCGSSSPAGTRFCRATPVPFGGRCTATADCANGFYCFYNSTYGTFTCQ
jgi:hypothetical protein